MFYIDSSVTVAAVTSETATRAVLAWLGENEWVVSDWVVTETSAALSQKRRMGLIGDDNRNHAQAAFDRLFVESSAPLSVKRVHFHRAAKLAERADTGLRAGDALHLAIAEDADATLVTLDRKQASAGTLLGTQTLLLG